MSLLFIGLLVLTNISPICCLDETIFSVDFSKNPSKVWKFWESGTTMDHGYLALRDDFREQLLQSHEDLNIEWVRFHSILDDDIGIVNPKNPSLPYSYINVDKIYDYIDSIGMKPLVELDFMPSTFVPANQTSSLYNYPVYMGPPSNYTQWYYFIQSFVQHLVDRYGSDKVSSWMFDGWNEPNSGMYSLWLDSNLTTFETTWNQTALAVKSVNKSFRIGSPGSVSMGWIPDFPQWCHDNKVSLDFVSTHMYPTKPLAAKTHNGYVQVLQNLSVTIKNIDSKMGIGLTAYGCTTEDNGAAGEHDSSYNAACYTTFASQFQQLDNEQFWIMSLTSFTDLWDQAGVFSNMFHNGLGWLTNRGIKKPQYHAMELLVKYASDRNYYNVHRNNSNEVNSTLELFTTISMDNKQIALFVMNWMLLNHPIQNETVQIELMNLDKIYNGQDLPSSATIYRIDDAHCNPVKMWQSMGSPAYPTPKQMQIISNSSVLIAETMNVDSKTTNSLTFKLDLPIYGMAVIVIDV